MKPLDQRAFASPAPWPGMEYGLGGAPVPEADFLAAAGLSAIERGRWSRLSTRAAPGNIFARDWFMEPALRHCGTEASLRLAVVRQASGEWLGVLPLTFEASIGRCPMPSHHAWTANNQFIGTPLVLPGAERVFWQGLLARLDRTPGAALALCCEAMPLDDAATLALTSLCAEQGRMIGFTQRYSRPARMPWSPGGTDLRAARKLDKRLDRLEQRLVQDAGPVSLMLHTNSEEVDAWIAAFLALERAGWKGRAASAMACQAATSSLFREAIRHGRKVGAVRLASLRAGDHVAAMSCWFVEQGCGYGFKMAHDETLRRYAPGRLLMRRVARLHASEGPLLFDTCTRPGTPSDPFWPDRRELASLAVAIGGTTRRALFARLSVAGTRWQERKAASRTA